MRIVYRAEHLIDAHLVKGRLESEGVPAVVLGEHLAGGIGELPVGGLMQVGVADGDVERAEALLAAWQEEQAAEDATVDPTEGRARPPGGDGFEPAPG